MVAWVHQSKQKCVPYNNIEQAACLTFNFLLLAAGLAGLGYHVQDIPLTHWPQLARVSCLPLSQIED